MRASEGEGLINAEELELGRELMGKVVGINKFGATMDIGADRIGWLHVSKIQKQRIYDINDALLLGEELKVRVLKVSPKEVEVCLRDDLPIWSKRPLSDFAPGDVVEGPVVHDTGLSVFVDVGAQCDAYLSIEQVQNGDAKPERMKGMFPLGSTLEAKVLKSGPNKLSITLRTDMGV